MFAMSRDGQGPQSPDALAWLEQFAISGEALGWVMVPAGDSEVRLVTNNHERLSRLYRLSSAAVARDAVLR